MRFALAATAAAAAVAVPFAVSVSGPQMSGDQFLSAVRCVAYQDVAGAPAELADAKRQLNAEARRQPLETAARAEAEAARIARNQQLTHELAAACAGAQLAADTDSQGRG